MSMAKHARFSTHTVLDSKHLVPWLAHEFGPHHVIVGTALSNIRITTFFAGESEVKIVDPSRIREVRPCGCEVQFVCPTESNK